MAKSVAVVLNLKDRMSMPLKDIAKKLGTTEKELKKATNTIGKFQKQAGTAFRNVGLGAIGMGAAFVGMVSVATNKTLAYAKEVKTMQRLTGESVENASKMVAVGMKYGISASSMAKGLRMLGIKAVNGGKDFAKYGLSVKNSHGQLLPASRLLENVADKYKQLGGGLKGAIFAQKLMGKSAMELIPLLAKGSKGLKEMEEEAKRMGFVLTKDNLTAFSQFGEAQKRYNQAMLGINITIGSKVLPILGQLAEKANLAITKFDFKQIGIVTTNAFNFIGKAIKFCYDNMNIIIPALTIAVGLWGAMQVINIVASGITTYNTILGALNVTQGVNNALLLQNAGIATLVKNVQIIWNAVIAVSAGLLNLFKGQITLTSASMVIWNGVCKAARMAQILLNAAFIANPIGVVVVGIIGLISVGVLLYKNWDKIIKKASELWNWLKNITGFGNKIVDVKIKKTEQIGKSKITPGRKALGTPYFSGGITGINEGGRGEVINLPSGSQIVPHDLSKKAMNKSNQPININVNIAGNIIGNEAYADFIGSHIVNKLSNALAII